MQDRERVPTSDTESATGIAEPKRRLRSLVLAWHDEESGDELTIDVSGSERFLAGLAPLGFRRIAGEGAAEVAADRTHNSNSPRPTMDRGRSPAPKGSPDRKEHESTGNRVRWTVRLARYWNPKSR